MPNKFIQPAITRAKPIPWGNFSPELVLGGKLVQQIMFKTLYIWLPVLFLMDIKDNIEIL